METSLGERVADKTASIIGSWTFIIIQAVLTVLWVICNLTGFIFKWDVYPFILLNLMFSFQAGFTGPILLLAGNRQAQRDRAMATQDDEEIAMLVTLQKEQMDILRRLDRVG